MKRFLSMICLIGLAVVQGSVFLNAAEKAQNSDSQFFKRLQSTRWILDSEAQLRPAYNQIWNGKGTWLPLRAYMTLGNGGENLGLSEEQSARLAFLRKESDIGVEIIREKMQRQDPEMMQAQMLVEKVVPQDDPLLEKATFEQQREYVAAESKFVEIITNSIDEVIEQTLTPEQMQKVQEIRLQLLPEMGFPSIAMFDTLGLTDEQRKEMEAIQKEMEPEFEKLVDEAVELQNERMKLMIQELVAMNKSKSFENDQQVFEAMNPFMEKADKNEQLQKKLRANSEKGQKFATLFKARLMNVLTDEQLDKMQKIMDDSPDFVKKYLAEKKQQRQEQEKAGIYTPGPDSWRPGDGAPEEFKKERKSRFPQKK